MLVCLVSVIVIVVNVVVIFMRVFSGDGGGVYPETTN